MRKFAILSVALVLLTAVVYAQSVPLKLGIVTVQSDPPGGAGQCVEATAPAQFNEVSREFFCCVTTTWVDCTPAGSTPSEDTVGTLELNDGSDTPVTGQCLVVASTITEIEYITCPGGASLPVVDTTSIAEGSGDATKEVRFEVDGITTGTIRVLTMADQNIDLTPGTGSFATEAEGNLAGTALQNVVEDTSPVLGADLGMSTFGLDDANGNELLTFTTVASADSHINIQNKTAGGHPTIEAVGGTSDINLLLKGKGDGAVYLTAGDSTKRLVLNLNAGTTGVSTNFNFSPTINRVVTWPDAAGEVSLLGQTIDLGSSEATGTVAAARIGADHIDAMSEIAAGIKRGPDATDTHIVTTAVAAPASNKCMEMGTDGSVVLASGVCAAAGSGDVSDVGPGCADGACWTDGKLTTGTTMFNWEGTVANTDDFFFTVPADPDFDVNWVLTQPTVARTQTFPDAGGEFSLLGQTIDLASEVTGTLPAASVGNGLNDTQVLNNITIDDATDAGGIDQDKDGTREIVSTPGTSIGFDYDDDGTADCTMDSNGIGCLAHATDGGILTLLEGVDDGVNTFKLNVPNSGLSGDRSCQIEDDATPFDACVSAELPLSALADHGDLCVGLEAVRRNAGDTANECFVPSAGGEANVTADVGGGVSLRGSTPKSGVALNIRTLSSTFFSVATDLVTLVNTSITYAKIQNVSATDRFLGRDTAGAGVIEEITPAAARTILGIEAGSTADQSDAEIKTAYENNADTNEFSDAEQTNLANQSGTNTGDNDEVPFVALADHGDLCTGLQAVRRNTGDTANECYTPASADGVGVDEIFEDGAGITKRAILNFIGVSVTCIDNASRSECTFTPEANATADQTGAEIKTAYDGENFAANSMLGNNTGSPAGPVELTSTQVRALLNVENAAAGDQTDAQIKTSYENNADTNEFDDAEQTLLGNQSGSNTGDELVADLTTSGTIEIADGTETNTGTDATRAVSPDGLDDWTGSAQITTLATKFHTVNRCWEFDYDTDSITTSDEYTFTTWPSATTVTRIDCESWSGTSFTISVCKGEDRGDDTCTTDMLSPATLACTTTRSVDSSPANTALTARQPVTIVVTAVSGTVTAGEICIEATID